MGSLFAVVTYPMIWVPFWRMIYSQVHQTPRLFFFSVSQSPKQVVEKRLLPYLGFLFQFLMQLE
jgi:hypothetical protein